MSFKTVQHLLFEKKKPELDVELLEEFNPWITTKSVTFLAPELVEYVNETLNTYSKVFESKEDKFRFFQTMIVKSKKRKFTYIKRPKEEKKELDAIPEFYSRKEIDNLIEFFK